MKCLILAAGYATRLYPLTEHFPKPLLNVQGRPILDWLIEDLDSTGAIDQYVVISNARYVETFRAWANADRIVVLSDGTTTNETRLGAVRDIAFAIKELEVDEDFLVIAGDNLLDFSLKGFLEYSKQKGTSCVTRYYEPDEEALHHNGIACVDENDRITEMTEKPASPKSHWVTPPFYYFRREDIPYFEKGLAEGCGVDAPGSFIAYLSTQTAVHAYEMPGRRYDIGTVESYEAVQREYVGIRRR